MTCSTKKPAKEKAGGGGNRGPATCGAAAAGGHQWLANRATVAALKASKSEAQGRRWHILRFRTLRGGTGCKARPTRETYRWIKGGGGRALAQPAWAAGGGR